MVQPTYGRSRGVGSTGGVAAQPDQLGDLVVRQPELDALVARRQVAEADRCRRARASVVAAPVAMSMLRTLPPSAVARPARRPSTTRSYTPSGRGGAPTYASLVRQDVQLEDGRGRAEHEAYARRLRLGLRELVVGDLGARPGGEAVGEQAVLRRLELDGAADEVGGDRGPHLELSHGDHLCRVAVRRRRAGW